MSKFVPIFLIITSVGLLHGQTTFFSDSFDRTGNLLGSAPDVSSPSYPTGKWGGGNANASDTATTDGSEVNFVSVPGTGNSSSYYFQLLPSTGSFSANTLYTFSFDLPQVSSTVLQAGSPGFYYVGLSNRQTGISSAIAGIQGVYGYNATTKVASLSETWNANNDASTKSVTDTADVNGTGGTQVTITLNSSTGLVDFYLGSAGASGTADWSYTYSGGLPTPASGSGLYVVLSDSSVTSATALDYSVSNVAITTTALATPEPSSLALGAAGLAFLVFIRRFRRGQLV